jgi:hypothetical protein
MIERERSADEWALETLLKRGSKEKKITTGSDSCLCTVFLFNVGLHRNIKSGKSEATLN